LGEYAGGGLFEIAFSLDESGEHDEAKKVYEYLIELSGETSAAMNNLAIIYEKKGDLIKAREYIKKAKSLLGEASDEIIDRNYARLIQHSKRQSNAAKIPNESKGRAKRHSLVLTFKAVKLNWATRNVKYQLVQTNTIFVRQFLINRWVIGQKKPML